MYVDVNICQRSCETQVPAGTFLLEINYQADAINIQLQPLVNPFSFQEQDSFLHFFPLWENKLILLNSS